MRISLPASVLAAGLPALLLTAALTASPAAARAGTGLEVAAFNDGTSASIFVSPNGTSDPVEDSELVVDVFHDKVVITEFGGLPLGLSPSGASGCTAGQSSDGGATVTCLGNFATISVFTKSGDDVVSWLVPTQAMGKKYNTDCGEGADEAYFDDGTAGTTVDGYQTPVSCEFVEANDTILIGTDDGCAVERDAVDKAKAAYATANDAAKAAKKSLAVANKARAKASQAIETAKKALREADTDEEQDKAEKALDAAEADFDRALAAFTKAKAASKDATKARSKAKSNLSKAEKDLEACEDELENENARIVT